MDPTTRASESPRCHHVHDSGQRCGSPALRDHDFCYYHERLHHPMPHPVKTPAAFLPPLESPEAILLAATNIARAVGMGQLTDKQARNMNASLRMARWALEQRAQAAAEGHSPQLVTELPDAMARVLTAARTEVEPEKVPEGALSQPSAGQRTLSNNNATPNGQGSGTLHNAAATSRQEPASAGRREPATLGPRISNLTTDNFTYLLPANKRRFSPSPLKDHPPHAPLDENQIDYCRWVINCYGYQHPEYEEAHRRLTAHIASGAAS